MLHLVNQSPRERNALDACLRMGRPNDTILLIEDGVYAAARETATAEKMRHALETFSIRVLGPDLAARGIAPEQVIDGIGVVDYGGFVDLAVAHYPVQSWF